MTEKDAYKHFMRNVNTTKIWESKSNIIGQGLFEEINVDVAPIKNIQHLKRVKNKILGIPVSYEDHKDEYLKFGTINDPISPKSHDPHYDYQKEDFVVKTRLRMNF